MKPQHDMEQEAAERDGLERENRRLEQENAELKAERDDYREGLNKAGEFICEISGACPYDQLGVEPWSEPCATKCDSMNEDINLCWAEYFKQE